MQYQMVAYDMKQYRMISVLRMSLILLGLSSQFRGQLVSNHGAIQHKSGGITSQFRGRFIPKPGTEKGLFSNIFNSLRDQQRFITLYNYIQQQQQQLSATRLQKRLVSVSFDYRHTKATPWAREAV